MSEKESDGSVAPRVRLRVVCGYNCLPYDYENYENERRKRPLGTTLYISRDNNNLSKRGEICIIDSAVYVRSDEKDYDSVVRWMADAPFTTGGDKVCDDCLSAKAEISCEECEEIFCTECSSRVHSGGKRVDHDLVDIAT